MAAKVISGILVGTTMTETFLVMAACADKERGIPFWVYMAQIAACCIFALNRVFAL